MEVYTSNTHDTNLLSQEDRHILEVGSGIARDLIERRSVYTIERGRDLPKGFSRRQRERGPGILFKVHRPNGKTSWSFRPWAPDPENPGHKYEQPCKAYGGPGNVLDVHPDNRHLIPDTGVPVFFVEGIKKADALATAQRAAGIRAVVIAISGVWNWLSGKPISDMLDIPLEGRSVTIVFDSDMLTNSKVQDAAGRLAEYLGSRGADTWITYFKDADDGSKVGADDFFVAGGTVSEMRILTRRYDPEDFARIHLARDAKLRAAVEDLWRRWWNYDWVRFYGAAERPHIMRGHSCKGVVKALINMVERHGRVVGNEVYVDASQYTLAEDATTRQPTVSVSVKHLEAEEWLEFRPSKDKEKPGTYVFRVSPYQVERKSTTEQNEVFTESLHRGDTDLRTPPLRWSAPTFHREDGQVVRGYIHRLGKINEGIIHRLEREGEMDIHQVAEALRCRARDLTRNTEIRKGNLVRLEEAGIVAVSGETVRLTEDWEAALQRERELKGEIDAAERQRSDHKRKREAFRNRDQVNPDQHWANTGADGRVEDLCPADEPDHAPDVGNPETSPAENPAVLFVLDYVARLGKIRLGLLEECWYYEHGGDLAQLRRAVDASGVRKMRLPEYREAVFLFPPLEDRGAA